MPTTVERNFRLSGIIDCAYTPPSGAVTTQISNIEVQAWHQSPTSNVLLGKAFTNTSGEYVIDFQISSPVAYIESGKIRNVFIKTLYNGIEIEPVQLDADAKLYLDQLTPAPSLKYRLAVNALVVKLKNQNSWQHLDRLWNFATEDQAHAVVSIKNPVGTLITEVNSPTWQADKGYTGDGSSTYLNSNFKPYNGGLYSLNNASFGCYIINDLDRNAVDIGVTDTANWNYIVSRSSNETGSIINTNNALNVPNNNSKGFYALERKNSSSQQLYKNGSLKLTGQDASSALVNDSFYILANNYAGSPSSHSEREIAMVFIGTSDINQEEFYAAIQEFATTIGFNI